MIGRRQDGSTTPIELTSASWIAEDSARYVSIILRDVAAFWAAKAALQESQTWLRTVTDTALAGLLVVDRDYTIRYANRAYAVLFNLASHDVAGFALGDILPDLNATSRLRIDQAFAGSRTTEDVVLPVGEAGRGLRHLAATYEASRNALGEQVVVVVATDVTEIKQTEAALRASRDMLQSVLDGTGDAIFAKDSEGRYVMVNRLAARHIGKPRDAILGRDDLALFGPETAGAYREQDRAITESGRPMEIHRALTLDGELRNIIVTKRSWIGPDGRSGGIVGLTRDVTEQLTLARERRQLAKRLVGAQEAERLRIARELHDQVGQNLTGLSLGIKELEERAGTGEARSPLVWLRGLTDEISASLHRTALQLRPTSLDDFGLKQAITSHVAEWGTRFNLEVDVALDALDTVALSSDAQLVLYRCVQETLTNTIKHAQACHIGIVVQTTPTHIRLIIEDDGVGFDPDAIHGSPDGGLGLLGLRERIGHLGGDLTIESTKNNGAAFFFSIPFDAEHVVDL